MSTAPSSSWNDTKAEVGVIAIAGGRNAQLFVKGNGGVSGIIDYTPAPAAPLIVSTTLTPAQLLSRYIMVDAALAVTLTLPSVAALEAALNPGDGRGSKLQVGSSFEFSISEFGLSNTVTLAVGAGWSHSGATGGSAVVAANSSGRFMARKTGSGSWEFHRLA